MFSWYWFVIYKHMSVYLVVQKEKLNVKISPLVSDTQSHELYVIVEKRNIIIITVIYKLLKTFRNVTKRKCKHFDIGNII